MENPKDVAQIVATIGIPGVLLFILVYGAWKCGQWTANNVVKPVVLELCQFVQSVNENVKSMTAMLDALRRSQGETIEAIHASACRFQNGQPEAASRQLPPPH